MYLPVPTNIALPESSPVGFLAFFLIAAGAIASTIYAIKRYRRARQDRQEQPSLPVHGHFVQDKYPTPFLTADPKEALDFLPWDETSDGDHGIFGCLGRCPSMSSPSPPDEKDLLHNIPASQPGTAMQCPGY
ncbi:hypothetical protein MKEN_00638000 [Mycena kentingensis (nom. inval.)]|nr:hypothetical protein MKEN_00638000 [Mycena kentingensis (nom. inval.)]